MDVRLVKVRIGIKANGSCRMERKVRLNILQDYVPHNRNNKRRIKSKKKTVDCVKQGNVKELFAELAYDWT